MNDGIAEKIIWFMNLAEKRYQNPKAKEDFVIRGILELYPELSVKEVKELIGVFITVSKLSTKMLFNMIETDCSRCNIL